MRIPEYVVHDAVIHYDTGAWRAQINATNFLDKAYVAQCTSATQCFYAERRKILASLTYRW